MNVNTSPNLQHPAYRGIRSTLVGIIANAILALIKGTAGILGNSYALIADAIESGSDIVSSLIVWLGLRFSIKPPDDDHPYGHGKAEPLAAAFVSLVLLGAAVTIAVASIHEVITPHHLPASFTLLVLVLVVAVKETLFRFVFSIGEEVGSTAVRTDAWHHRSDALTSLAAFIGISIAIIGGKGYEPADDYAALFAAAIIAYNAVRMLLPALLELSDVSPPPAIQEEVKQIARTTDGVLGVEKCYVRKMGFDHYVELHVVVDGSIPVSAGHAIAHKVQDAIRTKNPRIAKVLVHIEPFIPAHSE